MIVTLKVELFWFINVLVFHFNICFQLGNLFEWKEITAIYPSFWREVRGGETSNQKQVTAIPRARQSLNSNIPSLQ